MQNPSKDKRINTILVLTLVCLVALAGALFWIYRPKSPPVSETAAPAAVTEPTANGSALVVPVATSPAPPLDEKWGIQVSSLTLTNGGTAVDVQYTVLAPEKTAQLVGADAEVYLIDQASGTKIPMLTAALDSKSSTAVPARTVRRMMRAAGDFPPAPSRLFAGGSYSLLIPNWGQAIKAGAKVTVVVGNSRVENLTVQ